MKFYQELTLLPDAESSPYFLWSKVYTQIHIALAHAKNEYQLTGFGVSFPQYRFEKQGNKTWATLGVKLRVFAQSEEELHKLNLAKWLERLADYVHLKSVQAVPKNHRHAIFKRHHPKNLQKVAGEFAEFKGIDFETALKHCQTYKAKSENYPFIALTSETTGQDFRLHIIKEMAEQATQGEFSSYGLGVSVPDF